MREWTLSAPDVLVEVSVLPDDVEYDMPRRIVAVPAPAFNGAYRSSSLDCHAVIVSAPTSTTASGRSPWSEALFLDFHGFRRTSRSGVVELRGIEPLTSSLRTTRSTN